jgi:hypothetical protein
MRNIIARRETLHDDIQAPLNRTVSAAYISTPESERPTSAHQNSSESVPKFDLANEGWSSSESIHEDAVAEDDNMKADDRNDDIVRLRALLAATEERLNQAIESERDIKRLFAPILIPNPKTNQPFGIMPWSNVFTYKATRIPVGTPNASRADIYLRISRRAPTKEELAKIKDFGAEVLLIINLLF